MSWERSNPDLTVMSESELLAKWADCLGPGDDARDELACAIEEEIGRRDRAGTLSTWSEARH